MRLFLIILLGIVVNLDVFSQELKCRIQVVSPQVQGTNKDKFTNMQKDLFEFINNRKWTNHAYTQDEKIECNILINISTEIGADEFKGTMQIQASRPVFNSTYNSVLMNYVDNDVHFRYVEFQAMEFNEQVFTDNLTSLIAYYIYIILGIDYDSFSLEGGTPYYQVAENIVQKAQTQDEFKGWKAFENNKNRYWMVENMLNENYRPLREFYYSYHRMGLDRMADKTIEARGTMVESLNYVQKAYRNKTISTVFLRVLFDAKADEFVNIFSESFPDEKARVVNILKEVDPANIGKYNKIMKQQ
ncbi:MAG TPA: DUF4835 domain-containing protein [Bacteroidales bacterium]|nr:MAG: hypothetical protein A2W98_07640 [Bacteroidetes bacterium GWF2_33_38]OFY76543.1 MAG: hypothetical protein A2265_10985 [Bacteroidetes bacterium RIFOXYA12_FULL_33_9]OFY87518.1 MAG: hypothetical protein A2236_06540 [Bacteroidetes bacterium RIFOXYA2_FULL_33_7]HBF87272.1 DUF4835 domain-containing protein [Bacteroidales bacterium]